MKKIAAILTALVFLCLALPVAAEDSAGAGPDPRTVFEQAAQAFPDTPCRLIDQGEILEFLNGTVIYCFLCHVTPAPDAEPCLGVLAAAWAPESGVLPLEVTVWPLTGEDGSPAVPTADYLWENVLAAIAGIGPGSAGSSLRQAQAVFALYTAAAQYRFDRMDAEAVRSLLQVTVQAMTEDERTSLRELLPSVRAEALRLCDPEAVCGGEYADAGVARMVDAMRADEGVRASLTALLDAAAEGLAP